MEVVVVSDTHLDLDFIDVICSKHPNADMYLHAGDSNRAEHLLEPFITVRGNGDFLVKARYRILEVYGIRIYLFHGHTYPHDLYMLASLAKANQCQVIIHGHTHKPYYQFVDGVHILCPGSTRYPRGGSEASYALITGDKDKLKVEIITYEK